MRILMSVTTWDGLRIQADLAALGYPVTVADDGIGIFERLDRFRHPVVLLETGLPDLNWHVALGQLRTDCPGIAILVIDSDNVGNQALALELGADDILDRDATAPEIAARITAVAARRAGYSGPVLHIGPLKVSLQERRVWWGGTPIHMSPAQYNIFETLCLSAPDVISKDEILREIHGIDPAHALLAVDIFMATLRSRLVGAGAPHNLIETVQGRGYRLVEIRPTDAAMTIPRDLQSVDLWNVADRLRAA